MIRVPAIDNAQITADTPPSTANSRAWPASSLRPAWYAATEQMAVSRPKARIVTTPALISTATGVVWLVMARARNRTEPIETTVRVT